jgi:hypothetical protein
MQIVILGNHRGADDPTPSPAGSGFVRCKLTDEPFRGSEISALIAD